MDEQNKLIETTKETFAQVAEQNEEMASVPPQDDVFRLHEMRDALEASINNINEVNDKQRVVIDVLKAVEKEELSELINNLEDQSNYLVSQRNELELKREAMNKVLEIIQEDKKVYDTINTLLFGLGIFNNK